jgi:dnd system-associated protein 4
MFLYPDVRRPVHHEELLKDLSGDDGIFETMRDVLVFSASVGFARGRREEFTPNQNAIAWSTMAANQLFEQILLMITASTTRDTPEQLGDSAVRERVKAFEEYACGGLSIIVEEMRRGLLPEKAVLVLLGKEISEMERSDFDPLQGGSTVFDPFV